MAVRAQYLSYVLEQLSGLGALTSRRMFGGVGLYSGELFFGLIDDDTLFFKTDDTNSAEYVARGMPRFMPPANRPMGPMGYHQVPADVIEDAEALVGWARQSVTVALASSARSAARPLKKRKAKSKASPRKKKQPAKRANPKSRLRR